MAVLWVAGAAFVVLANSGERERGTELARVERKLCGAWEGQTGCSGDFRFRADGTFELKHYGPGGMEMTGSWRMRTIVQPPTLILTRGRSEDPDEVGKTLEFKVVHLDAKALRLKSGPNTIHEYERVKP